MYAHESRRFTSSQSSWPMVTFWITWGSVTERRSTLWCCSTWQRRSPQPWSTWRRKTSYTGEGYGPFVPQLQFHRFPGKNQSFYSKAGICLSTQQLFLQDGPHIQVDVVTLQVCSGPFNKASQKMIYARLKLPKTKSDKMQLVILYTSDPSASLTYSELCLCPLTHFLQ